MTYETVEKISKAFHKNKVKTILICVVLLIAFIITSYLNGWFGEKGKQHATSGSASNIKQETTGNQSPAIYSKDGSVNIQYNNQEGLREELKHE